MPSHHHHHQIITKIGVIFPTYPIRMIQQQWWIIIWWYRHHLKLPFNQTWIILWKHMTGLLIVLIIMVCVVLRSYWIWVKVRYFYESWYMWFVIFDVYLERRYTQCMKFRNMVVTSGSRYYCNWSRLWIVNCDIFDVCVDVYRYVYTEFWDFKHALVAVDKTPTMIYTLFISYCLWSIISLFPIQWLSLWEYIWSIYLSLSILTILLQYILSQINTTELDEHLGCFIEDGPEACESEINVSMFMFSPDTIYRCLNTLYLWYYTNLSSYILNLSSFLFYILALQSNQNRIVNNYRKPY